MSKKYRLQLISPTIGEKIYETRHLDKGIDKCYREFKSLNTGSKSFTIMDLFTYQVYKYAVNNNKQKNNLNKDEINIKNNSNNHAIFDKIMPDIDDILNKINDLNSSIKKLKYKLNSLVDE